MRAGEVKELKVIVKGDVQGSVEALSDALRRLSTAEVKLDIIHSSAGAISETDVTLAAASSAMIIGFNIRPEPKAAALAEKRGRRNPPLHGHLRRDQRHPRGDGGPARADLSREGAGTRRGAPDLLRCRAQRSRARWSWTARSRAARARGWCATAASYGKAKSVRSGASRTTRAKSLAGYECGIGLENFNDVKPGDVIEAFEMETVLRKLGDAEAGDRARPGRGPDLRNFLNERRLRGAGWPCVDAGATSRRSLV